MAYKQNAYFIQNEHKKSFKLDNLVLYGSNTLLKSGQDVQNVEGIVRFYSF